MTQEQLKIHTAKNLVQRLRGTRASDNVKAALTGPARLYLETWVIPALEILGKDKPTREEL